ncbi:SLBB domain-containing protein [bacterium]|nr:SLBB domain-containing protein [bacterium]
MIFLAVASLWAQQASQSMMFADLQQKTEATFQKQVLTDSEPLESSIDPALYRVGPGDVFQVNVWGKLTKAYSLAVTPEMHIIVPEFGVIELTPGSLLEAKQNIAAFFNSRFRDASVSVTLSRLRRFRVHVTGAVREPGTVVVTANTRVYAAVKMAKGLRGEKRLQISDNEKLLNSPEPPQPADSDEPELPPASLRNIQLIRNDSTTVRVDLQEFMIGGDTQDNPFLQDGDMIFVPARQEEVGQLAISGAVKQPGEFEYVPGDNLADLFLLGNGFTIHADKAAIEVIRFTEETLHTKTIRINLEETNPEDVQLNPDDRVFVRYNARYHRKAEVVIDGEVKYPGEYSIIEGETKLSEVIALAGGFNPQASLSEAKLIRTAMEDIVDPEFERLKLMRVEDMTLQERDYFKIKSRENVGIVAVDFFRLFIQNDRLVDVPLLNRDKITIPSKSKTINVSGAVVRPGLITFVPGQTYQDYINQASGFSWNAKKRRARIIRGATGEWIKADKNMEIYLGDTIFIPEKPERDYWELFKDFMRVAYEIATVALVITQIVK